MAQLLFLHPSILLFCLFLLSGYLHDCFVAAVAVGHVHHLFIPDAMPGGAGTAHLVQRVNRRVNCGHTHIERHTLNIWHEERHKNTPQRIEADRQSGHAWSRWERRVRCWTGSSWCLRCFLVGRPCLESVELHCAGVPSRSWLYTPPNLRHFIFLEIEIG